MKILVPMLVGALIGTLVTRYMDKSAYERRIQTETAKRELKTLCWNCAHHIGWSHGWHAYTGMTPDSVIKCDHEIYKAQEEYINKICVSIKKYGLEKGFPFYKEEIRKAEAERLKLLAQYGITNRVDK